MTRVSMVYHTCILSNMNTVGTYSASIFFGSCTFFLTVYQQNTSNIPYTRAVTDKKKTLYIYVEHYMVRNDDLCSSFIFFFFLHNTAI